MEEAKQELNTLDPQFLARSGIDVENVEEKLRRLYQDPKQLEYVIQSLKVFFNSIPYLLEINDVEELRYSISECRSILNGTLFDRENAIMEDTSTKIERTVGKSKSNLKN